MSYKIRVKTLDGTILTYHFITKYNIENGLISFEDSRAKDCSKKQKMFAVNNVEIEPENEVAK